MFYFMNDFHVIITIVNSVQYNIICRGEVVANAEEDETIAYGDVDLDYLDQVRTSIPISKQKRVELYRPATVI